MQKTLCNGCFGYCGLYVHRSCSLDLENIHRDIFSPFLHRKNIFTKICDLSFSIFNSVLQLLVTS